MSYFTMQHGIFLKTSSNYNPQGNGLVESTNKNLIKLIKCIGFEWQREWHKHLRASLWVNRITPKKILKTFPYELVYEKEVVMPICI